LGARFGSPKLDPEERVRVVVNTECTFLSLAGVGHHTTELLRALRARAAPDVVDPYPKGAFYPIVRFWSVHLARYHARRGRPGVLARLESIGRRAYLATCRRLGNLVAHDPFEFCVRRGRYDLYHEPNFIPLEIDLPTVVTVHDLSVLRHPEWHVPSRVAEYGRAFERGLARACHLLTVSEFTKREIVQLLGWPAERVSVTYNGRRPSLRPLAPAECAPVLRKLKLAPGYLLHVGTLEPRKNLLMLLRAYGALPGALRERHPLVLVGGRGWNATELEAALAAVRDGTVRRLGYVADEDLSALYSSARALVFPTLYEGFGMPTVEMLACGGAVLASTAAAVAETVGGAAHLIDPHDEAGWRDAMTRACTDDDWWNALRAGAVEAAKPFTWDRCADQTLEAYRKALGQHADVKRAA
jgi:glycosyltransferase involved in cell wall biosynthesis